MANGYVLVKQKNAVILVCAKMGFALSIKTAELAKRRSDHGETMTIKEIGVHFDIGESEVSSICRRIAQEIEKEW